MVQNRISYSDQHAIQQLHLAKLKPLLVSQDWKLLSKEEQVAFFRMLMRRITSLCEFGAIEAALELFRSMRAHLGTLGMAHLGHALFQTELKQLEHELEEQLQNWSNDQEIEKSSLFDSLLDQLGEKLQIFIDKVRSPNLSFFDRFTEYKKQVITHVDPLGSLEASLDPLLEKRIHKLRADLAYEEAFESQEPIDYFSALAALQISLANDPSNCELWHRLALTAYHLWTSLWRIPYLRLAFIAIERYSHLTAPPIELEQLSIQLHLSRYQIYEQIHDFEAAYNGAIKLLNDDELTQEIAFNLIEILIRLLPHLHGELDKQLWAIYLTASKESKEFPKEFGTFYHALQGVLAAKEENYPLLDSSFYALQKLLLDHSEDPFILTYYAELLIAKGAYFEDPLFFEQALALYQENLESLSTYHPAAFRAAEVAFMLICDYDEEDYLPLAEQFISLAISSAPHIFAYRFLQARILCKNAELNENSSLLYEGLAALEELIAFQRKKEPVKGEERAEIDPFLNKEHRTVSPTLLYDYATCLVIYSEYCGEVDYCIKSFQIWDELLQQEGESDYLLHQIAIAFFRCGDLRRDPQDLEQAASFFARAYQHNPENDQLIADWGNAYLYLAEILMDEPYKNEEMLTYTNLAQERLLFAMKLGNMGASYDLGRLHAVLNQSNEALYWFEIAHVNGHLPEIDLIRQEAWYERLIENENVREFFNGIEFP